MFLFSLGFESFGESGVLDNLIESSMKKTIEGKTLLQFYSLDVIQ